MSVTDWPIEDYPLAEIFLDQENIRTPISEKDQSSLILDLFDNEKAFEIAKSYAENGIYPDEFPIGIELNGKVIVIEGNRRIAALKALSEPDIVPAFSKKLKKLKDPKIDSIELVIAPDRKAAIKHIANRHTTNQKLPWKPLRQAYFYKSQLEQGTTIEQLIEDYPEQDISRFIKMLEMHKIAKSMPIRDKKLRDKIADERKFQISTYERYYDDKKLLGITFDKQGRVKGEIPKKEFEKVNAKLVEEIAAGRIDSRNSNKAKDRKERISSFPQANKPDVSQKGSFTSNDFLESENEAIESNLKPTYKTTQKTNKTSRKPPKGLFRKSEVPFKLSSSSLKIMYEELYKMDVAKCPNATHDFIRSFLECSLCVYLKSVSEYENISTRNKKKGGPTLGEMLTFLCSEDCDIIADANVKQVIKQVRSNFDSFYSLERMNMINHNENWVSSEVEVRSAWSKLETLVKFLLNSENS